MVQVFLSHSSKQKGYVEIVAKQLGKFNVVYDAWTFESGNKTLEEIYQGIDSTGIFVYFISQESLDSPWVEKEINKAEEYLRINRIKKFIPIIVDSKITHDNSSIPDWIKDEYNLRYISKPTKSYDLIRQALRLVSWDLYPEKKRIDQLFVGRTGQIRIFEERIFDFDKPYPTCSIVCGLTSIGRRKFLKHVLSKTNKIRPCYTPPILTLDSRNSIEDLIVKLYGFGYSEKERNFIANLSVKSIKDKAKIASKLICELYNNKDILFIEDNYCIISRDGHIANWYIEIINKISNLDGIAICLISQSRVKSRELINNYSFFSIDIPELELYERKALFNALIDNDNIELSRDDFRIISDQFTGYPEQIYYTLSLIKQEGVKYATDHLSEIIEYNTEKVAKIIRDFESNTLALQILKILSESEFLSLNILEEILSDDFQCSKPIITDFCNNFVIEFIGNTKEFLRLNDAVKDYIQRMGYKLEEKYYNNLRQHALKAFKDYDIIERDTSDYVLSFKEALKQGQSIPSEFLIPSHYINAMRESYNYDKKYKKVISLADRILLNEKYLDNRVLREIRYWLCSALARRRDKRLLEEVQKIDGPDHNFLLGFYYRLVGRHEEAIFQFKTTLEKANYYYRANRELIQVYP